MRIRGWWCQKNGKPSPDLECNPWDAKVLLGWRGDSEEEFIEFINKRYPDFSKLPYPTLLWYIDEEL